MMKYIDTSAFVKYYSEESVEKGASAIKALIDQAKEGKEMLLSSLILIGESVSVFDKWVRLRLLTKEDFAELLALFLQDLQELTGRGGLVFEGINSLMVLFSLDYIVAHSLAMNDSFHLYTALLHKNGIEEFISADTHLAEAAEKEGFRVWNPEK